MKRKSECSRTPALQHTMLTVLIATGLVAGGCVPLPPGAEDDGLDEATRLLKASAEQTMRERPTPIDFTRSNGAGGVPTKPGVTFFVGCVTDDPWVHPFVDVFRGAQAGWDTYYTVDPSQAQPGSGEVDGHVGSTWDFLGLFIQDDKPGDLFVLGDFRTPYYAGKTSVEDVDRDLVYIHRWEPGAVIRLHGGPDDYRLAPATNPETGLGGTAIFYVARGTDDLIGVVESATPEDLALTGPGIEYDFAPAVTPVIGGVDQLGNGGLQVFGKATLDPAGNLYQTFLSSGPDLPGTVGSGSFYIVKWNAAGERQWIRKYGAVVSPGSGNHGEMPFNIVATADAVFVSGHTKGTYGGPAPDPGGQIGSHAVVAKFDAATGDELEVRQLIETGFNGTAWCLALGPDNRLFVAGGTSDNGLTVPDSSPFVRALTQSDLAAEFWRDVIIDGRPIQGFDPSQWQVSNEAIARPTFDPVSRALYVSGYASQGDFLGGVRGITDAWIARYDLNGNRAWATAFQAPDGDQYPWAIATDSAGNVYVVGQTNGAMDGVPALGHGDGFIRKLTPDGTHVWTILLGTSDADELQDIRIVDDRLYVVGSTHGRFGDASFGMVDALAAVLDTDGNILSRVQFGTEKTDYPRNILVAENVAYVAGMTEGSMVGAYSGGGFDVFVATLDVVGEALIPRSPRSE